MGFSSQEYIKKCEESRKKIVRYARLVEDEEWIGMHGSSLPLFFLQIVCYSIHLFSLWARAHQC